MTPAAQMTVRVLDALVVDGHARSSSIADDRRARVRTVTPSFSSERAAFAESFGGKRGQDAVDGLDEQDPRRPRVDVPEVAAQRVARELADLPGHLDAGRACADDDEREPGVARRSGRSPTRRPRTR